MATLTEQIIELNTNFNCLGEDLVCLESVLQASQRENDFPKEYVASSLARIADYIDQHAETVNQLARYVVSRFTAS